MASLVLRGNIWHVVWRWRGKQRSRSTKVLHNGRFRGDEPLPPAAAKRELRKVENSLDQGHTYETKTLWDLLDLVKKEYEIAGFASLPSLNSRIQHLKDWFGYLRADRIVETDLLEYADFRRKCDRSASNSTINRELEVLRKALGIAKLSHQIKIKKLPPPTPRQGFFDDAKVAALCRALPEYLRAPVMFGYYTGWRREEVFGLEVKDVDFQVGEIRTWDTKNGRARVFPMDAVPGLRALLEAATSTKVILNVGVAETNRTSVNPSGMAAVMTYVFFRRLKKSVRHRIVEFRKAWATACRKAGCPGMLFHDLRRSAARNLELVGWPRSLIMEWMGHETEAMFHRYRIVSAADREIVSKRLAEAKKAAGTS